MLSSKINGRHVFLASEGIFEFNGSAVRKVTLDQYRKAIELNHKYFKYEDYSFIVGTPGESDKTIQESIDFCKEMGIKPNVVFFMTPYPGTPLFNELKNTNYHFRSIVDNVDRFENWISSLDENF